MKTKRITHQLITSVVKSIEGGLTNKEACYIHSISETTFYRWLKDAEAVRDTDADDLTQYQKLCVKFCESIKRAKISRKQKRIELLEASESPVALIFLLKNEYPREFNKRPYLIPNFAKLEEYMASEYTESEIIAIREAILAAEDRRQSEVEYEEDDLFTKDAENIPTLK